MENQIQLERGSLGSTRRRSRPTTLDGIDASFLYAERANVGMHTLKVLVLEPGSATWLDRDRLREQIAGVADALPSLRRRLMAVPLQIHHPRWIDVERIDIDAHLQFVELPAPLGPNDDDDARLCRLIAEIAGPPMPRTRPLWQLHVVTGLHDGRVAAIAKLHHSLADGRAAVNLLGELTSDRPGAWLAPAARGRLSPTRPSYLRLFVRALGQRVLDLIELPGQLARAFVRWLRSKRKSGLIGTRAKLFAGPRTFFNHYLGKPRRFAVSSYPVADIRTFKRALGVSFNDVFVGVIAGGFAALRRSGLVSGPAMVFSMPFGIDGEQPDRIAGNYVSNELCCLCDDIEDPATRIQAIARATKITKWQHEVLGPRRLREWTELSTRRWVALAWRLLPRSSPPPINLIISNVPGPASERYLGHTRIEALWSVGPLPERTGLNVTAWSYAGQLHVGLLCDASQWSERQVTQLRAGLDASFEQLRELAEESASSGAYAKSYREVAGPRAS